MNYWPGTNIIKSNGNAFTSWKAGNPSVILKDKTINASNQFKKINADAGSDPRRAFTIYSKAKASK